MIQTLDSGVQEASELNMEKGQAGRPVPGGREFNLGTILRDIWRRSYGIFCLAASAGLVAFVLLMNSTGSIFTVTATYVVTAAGSNNSAIQNLSTASSVADSFARIVSSSEMQSIIAKEMGDGRVGGTISASIVEETNLLQLRVTSPEPRRAFLIIRSIMDNQKMILNYLSDNVRLSVLVAPVVPTNTGGLEIPVRRSFLVFLGTLAVLTAVTAVLSFFRDTIRSGKDIEKKLNIPCLGIIGHEEKIRRRGGGKRRGTQPMLITRPTVSFPYTESIHRISRRLRNRMHRDGSKILMVTSVSENEGKSTTAANLALSLSGAGKKVLLIDLDMRRPSLYKIFEVEETQIDAIGKLLQGDGDASGLIQVLSREKICVILNTVQYGHSTELLSGSRLKAILNYLKNEFDYILIDTPPMQTVADAEVIADAADASVMIVREHQSPVSALNEALDSLRDSHAKPIGCILNDSYGNVGQNIGGYQYGYDYGYRYGSGYGKYYGRYYGQYGRKKSKKPEEV